jgi:hypothetical protein
MSLAAILPSTVYALAGAATGPFATVFPYEAASDVVVYLDTGAGAALLALPGDYSLVAANSLASGGNVTLTAGPAGGAWPDGSTLTLQRATASGQPSTFGEAAGFSPQVCEAALDHIARQNQDLAARIARALMTPIGEPLLVFPDAAQRASKVLSFDATGQVMLATGQTSLPVSALGAQVLMAETIPEMLAALGFAQTEITMATFAAQAGIVLGQGNDQPAIDAAEAAMDVAVAAMNAAYTVAYDTAIANGQSVARAQFAGGQAAQRVPGLYVKWPAGVGIARKFRPRNRCGYYCDPGTVLLIQRAPLEGEPDPEIFVQKSSSANAACMFTGFTLFGGWSYGRPGYSGAGADQAKEADPYLFQYGEAPGPNQTPDSTANFGQTAIQWITLFNDGGANDAALVKSSPVLSNDPRDMLADLLIAGFGGDAFYIEGAGGSHVRDIESVGCGGRGAVINAYDIKFSNLVPGYCGLESLLLWYEAASDTIEAIKAWGAGWRNIAGHRAGLVSYGGGNVITGQVQDPSGDFVVFWGGASSHVTLTCGYAFAVEADVAANSSLLTLNGAVLASHFEIVAAGFGTSTSPMTYMLKTTADAYSRLPKANVVEIAAIGFYSAMDAPANLQGFDPAWVDGVIDFNDVTINNARLTSVPIPDSADRVGFFLPSADGDPVGLIMGGPTSVQPGDVLAIFQHQWRISYVSGGAYSDKMTVSASQAVSNLPFRLPSFTTATVPSASALGAGTQIFVTDAGPAGAYGLPCTSDGSNWRLPAGTVL